MNPTVDDSSSPGSDSGPIGKIINGLAYLITQITGKSDWKTAPKRTLESTGTASEKDVTSDDGTIPEIGTINTFTVKQEFDANLEVLSTGGWAIFRNRTGIGGVPDLTADICQVLGALATTDSYKFMDSSGNVDNVLYTSGTSNILIQRNYANVSTLFTARSQAGDPTADDREATLALVRTDDSGNEEYCDFYNNGFHSTGEVNHGIRIQKRGTGSYRPFKIELNDGSSLTLAMQVSTDAGITIGSPSGGSQGEGTINAEQVHEAGTRIQSAAFQSDTRYNHRSNNLSDVDNASTSRNNLGLGSAAIEDTETDGGTIPQSSDLGSAARESDTRYNHRSNNLSDVGSASSSRSNLGLTDVATLTHSSTTVELLGDFDAGERVDIERIGNWVTIASHGNLTHASTNEAYADWSVIPSEYRPDADVYFCICVGSSFITRVHVLDNGDFIANHYDHSGSDYNKSLCTGFAVTYLLNASS